MQRVDWNLFLIIIIRDFNQLAVADVEIAATQNWKAAWRTRHGCTSGLRRICHSRNTLDKPSCLNTMITYRDDITTGIRAARMCLKSGVKPKTSYISQTSTGISLPETRHRQIWFRCFSFFRCKWMTSLRNRDTQSLDNPSGIWSHDDKDIWRAGSFLGHWINALKKQYFKSTWIKNGSCLLNS